MIDSKDFYDFLENHKIDSFVGVPDSLLKHFCAFVNDNIDEDKHIITANEGSSIALASGLYFGSGSVSAIYMQNSGLGNAINPLLSLADREVYSVPMLLLIGWRGEPNISDEPQHVKQGKVTEELLTSLDLPYIIITADTNYQEKLSNLILLMKSESRPVAVLFKKNTFVPYAPKKSADQYLEMNREDAIKIIVDNIPKASLIISTTGMTSRELYEYRESKSEMHDNDFLTVGSMGHASMIALGVSLKNPKKQVICIDGDGSILMHMGNLALTGQSNDLNFIHVMINNGAHDSVGGQPTLALNIDIPSIATSCGYKNTFTTDSIKELKEILFDIKGKSFIEIKVNKGHRKNLGRPKSSPIKNRDDFMNKIFNNE